MTPRSVQVWFQNRRAKQKKAKNKNKCPEMNGNQQTLDLIDFDKKYDHKFSSLIPTTDTMIFQPIQMMEQTTTFCNDRFPVSPLGGYPLKNFSETPDIQFNPVDMSTDDVSLQFPSVENLDSSWIDIRKQFDHDENLSENTICFDPDNFFG